MAGPGHLARQAAACVPRTGKVGALGVAAQGRRGYSSGLRSSDDVPVRLEQLEPVTLLGA